MSETAFSVIDNEMPGSSEPNRSVLTYRTPTQLLQEGYAERVEFTASQDQNIVSTETRMRDMGGEDTLMSTAISRSGGSIIQLPTQTSMVSVATMHALQEWEGQVLELGVDEFCARLRDLSVAPSDFQRGVIQDEEAIIPLCEISDDDVKRLHPGSVFRWVIGYERSASGTKRRVSQIVFRDLPAMTRQDIAEGREWARKVAQSTKR